MSAILEIKGFTMKRVFMRLLRFSILIILLLITSQVFAQSSFEERGYGIFIPSTYSEDSEPMPLVIALHGFGGEWRNFSRTTGLIPAAERYGFIVAFPNGYLSQWNDGSIGDHYEDDVEILLELIEFVAESHSIDRERIYLVGFSNGGTMVFRAACDAPNIFAGIASIGGTMRRAQQCEEEAATSVLIIHGTGDTVVPFAGGNGRYTVPDTANFWLELNQCSQGNVPDYDPTRFRQGVAAYYHTECANGHQVLMYIIEGMSHTWPGATEYVRSEIPDSRIHSILIIWGFFGRAYESQQAAQIEVTPEATEAAD